MRNCFDIHHCLNHLSESKDVGFDAVVYPPLGSDVASVLTGQDIYEGEPDLDDDSGRKERIVRQVVSSRGSPSYGCGACR